MSIKGHSSVNGAVYDAFLARAEVLFSTQDGLNRLCFGEDTCLRQQHLRNRKRHLSQKRRAGIRTEVRDEAHELTDSQLYPLPLPDGNNDPILENEVVEALHDTAFALLPTLKQIEIQIQETRHRSWVAYSAPAFAAEIRTNQRNLVEVRIGLEDTNGVKIDAIWGGMDADAFYDFSPEKLVHQAVQRCQHQALAQANTQPEMQGEMPVVFANGWGGVWLHEALGHTLEADVVLKGSSPFGKMLHQKVAPSCLTLTDDATSPNARGSYSFDDEGVKAQQTVLIHEGELTHFLTDRATAQLLGIANTANARRASFRHSTMPRMSNLILKNGNTSVDELMADVPNGLYVTMPQSARFDPTTRMFHVHIAQGYMIEKGRLARPVANLVVSGVLPEALHQIIGIGDDFATEVGRGYCEKNQQIVPISVGQPSVLFNKLRVQSF